uniref:Uncharacterized protein n=1 Tax=Tetraselmis chuii TaxID=63592 RepID=A0A7S1SU35_9CHLO|eukprot:CAMPEP_0177763706 /NCGR_PEP_ID=MMETSP0491_2-20121128/7010_1 /TAXON_ID=63592 /ORGANISM="Tetraselmis chuii, Strain PLY429" /LENGTH=127 /DNA_ID=CAMNT_0019279823 /DNA_START=210 /DNA_END=593 /DNA_ORIENTATION=-
MTVSVVNPLTIDGVVAEWATNWGRQPDLSVRRLLIDHECAFRAELDSEHSHSVLDVGPLKVRVLEILFDFPVQIIYAVVCQGVVGIFRELDNFGKGTPCDEERAPSTMATLILPSCGPYLSSGLPIA